MSKGSIIIAGTHSGVGKTTISVGIMAALKARELIVQPFKVGPDFIDPAYHNHVTGRVSRNLDGWMMGKDAVQDVYQKAGGGADISVIEGVMGLFDGIGRSGQEGSTAQVARLTGAPVVLVVDARSMAGSAAAVVKGFESLDPEIRIAGVILNRVGSDRHRELLIKSIKAHCKARVVGAIPRDEGLDIPSRHLGLTTDVPGILTRKYLKNLKALIENNIDLDALQKIAGRVKLAGSGTERSQGERDGYSGTETSPSTYKPLLMPSAVRLAVAMDEAFCFYYKDNLELLESYGAEIVPFSPLKDGGLPEGVSGVYLGGGYPEMYARGLSFNDFVKHDIYQAARMGIPVYAECGGLMYLTRGITDLEGVFYPMAGVLPTRARMLGSRKALGYREVTVTARDTIFPKGGVARGHEFHYSEIEQMGRGVGLAYSIKKGDGSKADEGYTTGSVLASYVHLHFLSNKGFARHFVNKMKSVKTAFKRV